MENNFKIGDKVKYIGNKIGITQTDSLIGCEAKILSLSAKDKSARIEVTKESGRDFSKKVGSQTGVYQINLILAQKKEPLTYGRALQILKGEKNASDSTKSN